MQGCIPQVSLIPGTLLLNEGIELGIFPNIVAEFSIHPPLLLFCFMGFGVLFCLETSIDYEAQMDLAFAA